MIYLIEVTVPKNIQALCCSHEPAKESTNKIYYLNRTDPERLENIVRVVRSASPNQFNIRLAEAKYKNRAFMDALWDYNTWHPNATIDPADLVKQISTSNYTGSFIGTTGDDRGKEFHAFEHIRFANGTKFPKGQYYVKIVNPEEGKTIDVVSLHRTSDNRASERADELGVYELSPAALKRFKQWKKDQT